MKARRLVFALGGFAIVAVGCLYLGYIASLSGPPDWTTLAQMALLFGPLGAMFGALAADMVPR